MKQVEATDGTILDVVEFNPNGICGNCGLGGSYDFEPGYRCQICVSPHVTELLEAADRVLGEFSEWELDNTPLRRLRLAAEEVQGRGRRLPTPENMTTARGGSA